jgi:hypothetical protein
MLGGTNAPRCSVDLTEREEAAFRLVYVSVDRATQLERIERHWAEGPQATFAMTSIELDYWACDVRGSECSRTRRFGSADAAVVLV